MAGAVPRVTLERLDAHAARAALDDMAALLHEAVEEGAGVSFLAPFTLDQGRAFWEGVLRDVETGHRVLLVARAAEGAVVGTTLLDRARAPNGRHRAEVQKVLVARPHRRQGVAGRLLAEAERVARAEGITLLVLDTGRDNGGAERLYGNAGYVRAGVIPRFWRTNAGDLADTVLYYKLLDGDAGPTA